MDAWVGQGDEPAGATLPQWYTFFTFLIEGLFMAK
jgi:hypothetical protein